MAGQENNEEEQSATWEIEVTKSQLTPLQYHYLSRLRHFLDVKASYKTNPEVEAWMINAINNSIISTFNALKVFR